MENELFIQKGIPFGEMTRNTNTAITTTITLIITFIITAMTTTTATASI